MLLSTTQSLEDLIVRILAKRRTATAVEIHKAVSEQFQAYSIPAVYKELAKLLENGVLTKRGKHYCLSLAWVLNLIELSDNMYDTHVENPEPEDILPATSKKTKLRFGSLPKLDDFWIHALIVILQASKSGRMYQWLPRPWFHLIHSPKTFPFHNALRLGGYKVESIIGGDAFLDQYSRRLTTQGVYDFTFARGPFQKERNMYYSVTDRHLLTVELELKKALDIDRFYDSIESWAGFDHGQAMRMLTEPSEVLVTIETTPSKVKRFWNTFIDFFEVSNSRKL